MPTPNILLHYWTEEGQSSTFQDILQQEIPASTLEVLQSELLSQLQSQRVQDQFPCFDWQSHRFQEKWDNITRSLVLQVSLPNHIWNHWIQEINNSSAQSDYLYNALGAETQEISPDTLLTAEVYFEAPEALEDLPEDESPEPEIVVLETSTASVEIIEEIVSDPIPSKPVAEIIIENVQVSPAPSTSNSFFQEEPKEQAHSGRKIMEVIADSTSEKVFEKLQGTDGSLKSLVETKMTETLANSISLNQKIKFIQSIFDGEGHHLNQLIEYIDKEAESHTWQEVIQHRYAEFQRADNEESWNELHEMIRRKFN
ncbi:hypothetical protein G9H62_00485 [Aquirufa ecclesiirivi]|uniref:hypothetical protein n=1 Tax=Aquirufa ecclesiirivi TaxID=2715124 RepID=UPI0022A8957C|nr:hypothetical protein [Aquirufa ecclesiirivi]MCZ2471301.1 hypothetical protein [Aquirufa ecclesiirivi]